MRRSLAARAARRGADVALPGCGWPGCVAPGTRRLWDGWWCDAHAGVLSWARAACASGGEARRAALRGLMESLDALAATGGLGGFAGVAVERVSAALQGHVELGVDLEVCAAVAASAAPAGSEG